MHRAARGILAIWHDIEPSAEAGTLDWYDREHHAERVDVPGFLSARRFEAIDAAPRLFIRYETEGPEVLESPAYLARVNAPTPWSERSLPTFRNMTRTVCRIAARAGRGEGGVVLTARLAGEAVDPRPLEALPGRLVAERGIVGAELWLADRARSSVPTREKELRADADHVVDAVAVLHGTREDALRRALAAMDAAAAEAGASDAVTGLYRLAFALDG
jgi:hypothetical protein